MQLRPEITDFVSGSLGGVVSQAVGKNFTINFIFELTKMKKFFRTSVRHYKNEIAGSSEFIR